MSTISVIVKSDLLIYAFLIDLILIIYIKRHSYKENYSSQLMLNVLLSIAAVTMLEAATWLSGELNSKSLIPIHYWSNVAFLSLIGLPAALAFCYLDYKISYNRQRAKKHLWFYLFPVYFGTALAIFNIFSDGFLFTIQENNQYVRGIGVYINTAVVYATLLAFIIYCFKCRHLISGRTTSSIMIFFAVPMLGALVQTLFYGLSLGMPSYTLAAFIIFLILEKDEMEKDKLTGLYLRSKIMSRLQFKLKSKEAFTIIMTDLDDFKEINDTFGHAEGDRALITVASVLKQVVNLEDMVCRFGGDEFLLLIECPENIAPKIMSRINHVLKNQTKDSEYNLSLSYGHHFVEKDNEKEIDELIQIADQRMYANKQNRRAIKEEVS